MAAGAQPPAKDPIFGLTYDPATVTFAPAPLDLDRVCPELTNARWTRRMWIFAQVNKSDTQYFVIGGYYVERHAKDEATPAAEADSVGAVIRLQGPRCELIGPAREVFDYPTKQIAPSQVRSLAKDAVCRYSRAFGTQARFMDALRRQHIRLDARRSSILKEAVEASAQVCQ